MIAIREPRASEAAACRLLLPEARLAPHAAQFRLAVDDGHIIGASAFHDDGATIGGVRFHVIPPHRRQGIASLLLANIDETARALGREKLTADAEPFLEARGFRRISRLTVVDCEIGKLRASWQAARQKLRPEDALPESARFVEIGGIDDATMNEIVRLYAEHIAHVPYMPGQRRLWNLQRFRDSLVLTIDGKVAGVLLAQVTDGVLHAPAWIVPPEYRSRHIGLWLRVTLVDRLIDRVKRARFEFLESATASAKVKNEAGYETVRVIAGFERDIAEKPD